ncbi:hypothetical protein ACOI1H_09160 [Loktanella sp. DJP18]|uniref:DUF7742 family protein n=1 Tax=Loktanella sp. DJP18 TaxID=3409788 RepID=UPI003BB5E2AD
MRPLHLTDLDIATRTLLALPVDDRATAAVAIVAGASLADRYRKRSFRRHVIWGDGTLAAAACACAQPVRPSRCDAAYRNALGCILTALAHPSPFDFSAGTLYVRNTRPVGDDDDGKDKSEPSQHRPCLGSHRPRGA